ncbi:Kae1-like domain-containing protein [Piscinibacter sakaiensis]|uniref:[NiFe] hydrogenase metallocenter assembly protein HypF n=1 Tax=Piscinibacter sakaiensis TaxID=1547922 RepID=A0A0K8P868_PISS1|nr:carbamoyltransferase HypF [Piscinibacter sakaiensis]GAP38827.1 [NiFe] hydrogenase metallocenter assembly protein HypF [Piscinibacter sakaiensis]
MSAVPSTDPQAAPPPWLLPRAAPRRVLALGAWLKNTACRLDGREVRMSALHGDLGDPRACVALEDSARALLALGPVDAIAHDLHPDFHSTRLALALAADCGVPAIALQHHHAHVAVVQAEQGLAEAVIGLALDGVGLGTDGTAWGGELLEVAGPGWQRRGRLRPLRLPGGDVAAREPWRVAAAVLHGLGRAGEIESRWGAAVGRDKAAGLRRMLDRDLNCPITSSAGRWFDAAAAALGLSVRQDREAEAALALEALATAWLAEHRPDGEFDLALTPVRADGEVDLYPLLGHLFTLADIGREQGREGPRARGAALFHLSLADALARWARAAAEAQGCRSVVLAGGCFFNRLLGERVAHRLREAGLRVLRPQQVGCGDAGLALGQAWAAAQALAASPADASDPRPRGLAAGS